MGCGDRVRREEAFWEGFDVSGNGFFGVWVKRFLPALKGVCLGEVRLGRDAGRR